MNWVSSQLWRSNSRRKMVIRTRFIPKNWYVRKSNFQVTFWFTITLKWPICKSDSLLRLPEPWFRIDRTKRFFPKILKSSRYAQKSSDWPSYIRLDLLRSHESLFLMMENANKLSRGLWAAYSLQQIIGLSIAAKLFSREWCLVWLTGIGIKIHFTV